MAYNPSNHLPISKPLGSGRFPIDGKMMFYTNGFNGVYEYRPFVSAAEVLSYFPIGSDLRKGNFEILINDGGVLSPLGDSITGGVNSVWWFRNGVADEDLVQKIVSSESSDLQNVTTVGNTTSRGMVITGGDGISGDEDGLVEYTTMGDGYSTAHLFNKRGTHSTEIVQVAAPTDQSYIEFLVEAESSLKLVNPDNHSGLSATFRGRISGQSGINPKDFITLDQTDGLLLLSGGNMTGDIKYFYDDTVVDVNPDSGDGILFGENTDYGKIYFESTGSETGTSNLVFENGNDVVSPGGDKEGFLFTKWDYATLQRSNMLKISLSELIYLTHDILHTGNSSKIISATITLATISNLSSAAVQTQTFTVSGVSAQDVILFDNYDVPPFMIVKAQAPSTDTVVLTFVYAASGSTGWGGHDAKIKIIK